MSLFWPPDSFWSENVKVNGQPKIKDLQRTHSYLKNVRNWSLINLGKLVHITARNLFYINFSRNRRGLFGCWCRASLGNSGVNVLCRYEATVQQSSVLLSWIVRKRKVFRSRVCRSRPKYCTLERSVERLLTDAWHWQSVIQPHQRNVSSSSSSSRSRDQRLINSCWYGLLFTRQRPALSGSLARNSRRLMFWELRTMHQSATSPLASTCVTARVANQLLTTPNITFVQPLTTVSWWKLQRDKK